MPRLGFGFVVILASSVLLAGCAKGPPLDEQSVKNANAGKASQQDQSAPAPPFLQQTLKGDIERISLAISMAGDASKRDKPQEAVWLLEGARKEVDAALGRKPRLNDELDALKSAIDRAIPAVEKGGKDAEIRLTELQTRIGAIKVNTFSQ